MPIPVNRGAKPWAAMNPCVPMRRHSPAPTASLTDRHSRSFASTRSGETSSIACATRFAAGWRAIALTHTGIEFKDADRDVELHTSGYVERAEFYADSATSPRTLTGRRLRTSTAVGDTVCHRGKSTGYSCGKVSKTNTILTYANACGTQTCSAVWVTVTGDSGTACYPGDSGGPVFISQTAVGLLKGGPKVGTAPGQCAYFYYMSTDYLPTGWSLLYG